MTAESGMETQAITLRARVFLVGLCVGTVSGPLRIFLGGSNSDILCVCVCVVFVCHPYRPHKNRAGSGGVLRIDARGFYTHTHTVQHNRHGLTITGCCGIVLHALVANWLFFFFVLSNKRHEGLPHETHTKHTRTHTRTRTGMGTRTNI